MSAPAIECLGLTCGYGGTPILENVELSIASGEIVCLLGGSGSGKSTLLKTLVGLLPPIAGEVRLLGENPYALPDRQRAALLRRTGTVFQQGALLGSRTVGQNVGLLLEHEARLPADVVAEAVRAKLALVGLEGLEDRLPAEISGGQRKRVGLARACILDPEVIFCDEPSAGLDPITAASLDATFLELRKLFGLAIIAVTHELPSIRLLSDRAVMVGEGKVLAAGTVDELEVSDVPFVRDFFARKGQEQRVTGATAWDSIAG